MVARLDAQVTLRSSLRVCYGMLRTHDGLLTTRLMPGVSEAKVAVFTFLGQAVMLRNGPEEYYVSVVMIRVTGHD